MNTTKCRLWFVSETEKARRYCRLPMSRHPGNDLPDNPNYIWVPKSVMEHVTKYPPAEGDRPIHVVEVADWFADKENL